jgi:uncharacterized protein YkwD
MLRTRFVAALAACVAAGSFAAPSDAGVAAVKVSDSNALEAPLLRAINGFRAQHGLRALRASAPLARAAQAHAVSMAQGGYFSHTSADGTSFWKRIRGYYPYGRFSRWSVGENLLWRSAPPTPEEALQMWIESPAHRKVLLTAAYREVGVAAVAATAAPGAFGSLDVTIVAADFGVRT